ncbi:MAG: LCP family protein [Ruminococcus sp.]|nr:LCP family protein [Ruminococcus sp.]
MIKKINYSETGSRNRTNGALSKNYVTSVLLIGTDGRSETEQGRSDTMILLSLNSKSKTINLTSFMRDCYVEIPNYGWNKLNSAYSYGGAELLMDTIEHNFGIKIDDYVSVNFVSFANIIDSVGGIKIDISDAEAQEINTILQAEVNSIMGDDTLSDLLSGGGKDILLNGKQALSYARIRYVGNADFERTERQRKVIELVMNKVKSFSPSSLSNISKSVMPNVSTNMPSMNMYTLSLRVPLLVGYETQQLQIPAESTYYGEYVSDVGDSLIVDFDANYNIIKQNVFSE